jgi:hypothetical protein
MGVRRVRRQQRQADMAESRTVNGMLKTKERVSRDRRMVGFVGKGKLPYIPSVMQLGKPSKQITQADVDKVVKSAKA